MRFVDGGMGEGGGQVLRSALALAACLGEPVTIERVRAGRARPGLRPQHLAAVRAVAAISGARVEGAEIGSQALRFEPGRVRADHYHFDVGTAGSATLVLQTVLPALMRASGPSGVVVDGGTHNAQAPPFEFLARAYLPLVARLGPAIEATLERPGFYPAGGGRLRVSISPASRLTPFALLERGPVLGRQATALLAHLPRHIGERELAVVAERLGWPASALRIGRADTARSAGNALLLEVASAHVTEVFVGFGRRGVPAETVAEEAVAAARRYLDAEVPVGPHLADQLLLPLALAGGGAFVTVGPTSHTETHARLIEAFLPMAVHIAPGPGQRWRVDLVPRG